ncbi:four helix bundle protein [Winogradskyella forsetii]|uniref:four helix bundle protein n=1 Tax=Winogradskyella forsetii TaxID=2686077 RepID=UPI0015BB167F|nr:four helix bundle protein [Winogradskyella forsetii]
MNYTELDVWIKSRELVKSVYLIGNLFPKDELFSLTNQVRRCSVSVPSNIAEGLGRQYNKETIQFLYISRGSLYELETQLYLAFDLDYISNKQLETILEQVTSCKKLLNGFIKYFKSKN